MSPTVVRRRYVAGFGRQDERTGDNDIWLESFVIVRFDRLDRLKGNVQTVRTITYPQVTA